MLTYQNNSDTLMLVAHEIYGINDHIKDFCEIIAAQGIDVLCPNLLGRAPFSYDQEDVAYQYFLKQVGLPEAATGLRELLCANREHYQYIYITGFSVGATIAWLCCAEQDLCDGVIGFYGSRIRDYLHIEPAVPVLLLFPSEEKSFEVSTLVNLLNKHPLVNAKIYPGKHGFADPYSEKYCAQAAQQAYGEMFSFLSLKQHK